MSVGIMLMLFSNHNWRSMCHICIIIMYDLSESGIVVCVGNSWLNVKNQNWDQIRDCHHQQASSNSPKVKCIWGSFCWNLTSKKNTFFREWRNMCCQTWRRLVYGYWWYWGLIFTTLGIWSFDQLSFFS